MHRSLLIRQLLPALLGYLGLIVTAVIADVALHRLGLRAIGLWLGPLGTACIAGSFLYSLRKRKLITAGQPRQLLRMHESLSWLGALLVVVHAGAHFSALLPWLALGAMLIVVASGFTGSVLLKRAVETLRTGRGGADADEDNALLDAATVDRMKRWREIHLPLNAAFLALLGMHLASLIALRNW